MRLQDRVSSDLEFEVTEICRYAGSIGVNLILDLVDEEEDPVLWIGKIARTHGRPGAGREVLEQLLELAEEYEIPVEGQIDDPYDTLAEYYRDIGFDVVERGRRTLITTRG